MCAFNEFLLRLDAERLAAEAAACTREALEKMNPGGKIDANSSESLLVLSNVLTQVNVQINLKLLREYHEWLEEQLR